MKSLIPVGVAGMGKYVPERRLTNSDLEKMVDTSDEWIMQRTGIAEFYLLAPQFDFARRAGAAGENACHARALGQLGKGEAGAVPFLVARAGHAQLCARDERHIGKWPGQKPLDESGQQEYPRREP